MTASANCKMEASARVAKTVVVIDDEADNVESTVMLLQSAGHWACGATTGQAGIDLAMQHRPEVIVLDYAMPRMDGGDVARALRSHPLTRVVKILMCSATPEATVRVSFAQYDAFLSKPADGDDLLRFVRDL